MSNICCISPSTKSNKVFSTHSEMNSFYRRPNLLILMLPIYSFESTQTYRAIRPKTFTAQEIGLCSNAERDLMWSSGSFAVNAEKLLELKLGPHSSQVIGPAMANQTQA